MKKDYGRGKRELQVSQPIGHNGCSLRRARIIFVPENEKALRVAFRAYEVGALNEASIKVQILPTGRGCPRPLKAKVQRETMHQVIGGTKLAMSFDQYVVLDGASLPGRQWQLGLKAFGT